MLQVVNQHSVIHRPISLQSIYIDLVHDSLQLYNNEFFREFCLKLDCTQEIFQKSMPQCCGSEECKFNFNVDLNFESINFSPSVCRQCHDGSHQERHNDWSIILLCSSMIYFHNPIFSHNLSSNSKNIQGFLYWILLSLIEYGFVSSAINMVCFQNNAIDITIRKCSVR